MNTIPFRRAVGSARMILGLSVSAVLVASLSAVGAEPASAGTGTTFTVRFLDDEGDAELNDTPNRCDIADDISGAQCTLRAAIEEANHTPGNDLIFFDIGGTQRVKTIRPASSLPPLTETVTINGYSQPGASPNTRVTGTNAVLRIQLVGTDAGGGGITIESSDCLVRGLIINRFLGGVSVQPGHSNNRIMGNFIGTDASGTRDRGNFFEGVSLFGSGNFVGGLSLGARNLISGNDEDGVEVAGSGQDVKGNLIGTDRTGGGVLGNAFHGVQLFSSNHSVGGPDRALGNVIAHNGEDGVSVVNVGSIGNFIIRNSIFANGDLGIDLGDDGRTPNDPGDVDTGPNDLQNFPVLNSARTGRRTTIRGRLESTAGQIFTIQFFSNPPGSPAEGKRFIGQISATTNGTTGVAEFTFRPRRDVPVRHRITATAIATAAAFSTSEFSDPRRVRRA